MEFIRLLGLNILVLYKSLYEYCLTVWKYYSNKQFRKADVLLLRAYFFDNPFRISRSFLTERGEDDVYTYGETPLTTMDFIATECGIISSDCVYELGCGRGRTCFWLRLFKGCQLIGIEYVPKFVEIANKVKSEVSITNLDFRLEDMLQSDLTGATVIYLYGTCYDEPFIKALITKFEALPSGTKVITVSYSLQEFGSKKYRVNKTFPASFTWGEGDVYLQIKI